MSLPYELCDLIDLMPGEGYPVPPDVLEDMDARILETLESYAENEGEE